MHMNNIVRGKILANLANGKPFAKIFLANIFNTPNQIPEQNCNMLKYFKPAKQRHEDNNDKVKPKDLPDPNGDLTEQSCTVFFHRSYRVLGSY